MGGPDDFDVAHHRWTVPAHRRPGAALLVLALALATWAGLAVIGWLLWALVA